MTSILPVQPMPDEFMPGHIGRILRFNAIEPMKDFTRNIPGKSTIHRSRHSVRDVVGDVCSLIGMEKDTYLQRHTLTPIDAIAADGSPTRMNSDNPNQSRQKTHLMQLRRRAVLCARCAEADFESMGFSYWRRNHLIPGIGWCTTHNIPLNIVDEDRAYDGCPHQYIEASAPITDTFIENKKIQLYAGLSNYVLSNPRSSTRRKLAQLMNVRGKIHGLTITNHGNSKRLSDLARQLLPQEWVRANLPKVFAGRPRQYCTQIDGVSLSVRKLQGWVYLLAFSLVYDDATAVQTALSASAAGIQREATQADTGRADPGL